MADQTQSLHQSLGVYQEARESCLDEHSQQAGVHPGFQSCNFQFELESRRKLEPDFAELSFSLSVIHNKSEQSQSDHGNKIIDWSLCLPVADSVNYELELPEKEPDVDYQYRIDPAVDLMAELEKDVDYFRKKFELWYETGDTGDEKERHPTPKAKPPRPSDQAKNRHEMLDSQPPLKPKNCEFEGFNTQCTAHQTVQHVAQGCQTDEGWSTASTLSVCSTRTISVQPKLAKPLQVVSKLFSMCLPGKQKLEIPKINIQKLKEQDSEQIHHRPTAQSHPKADKENVNLNSLQDMGHFVNTKPSKLTPRDDCKYSTTQKKLVIPYIHTDYFYPPVPSERENSTSRSRREHRPMLQERSVNNLHSQHKRSLSPIVDCLLTDNKQLFRTICKDSPSPIKSRRHYLFECNHYSRELSSNQVYGHSKSPLQFQQNQTVKTNKPYLMKDRKPLLFEEQGLPRSLILHQSHQSNNRRLATEFKRNY